MRMRTKNALRLVRVRTAAEDGFTMLVAIGVMFVVSLLVAAAFVAAQGDIHNSQHDLDSKRAYYAARAGINAFLFKLNQNTELWQNCPTQSTTNVPGSNATAQYSYQPVPANGYAACSAADPINTMIDTNSASFSMRFTGTSGTNPAVSRTLVASFRRKTPLDYLWYTKYETLDPNVYSNPASFQDCATLLRDGRPSHCTRIDWITGDVINGPMYTQDQYSICGAPIFGRNKNDTIASSSPTNALYSVTGCANGAVVKGTLNQGASIINPPSDNTALLTYAQTEGKVYSGTTTVVLSGTTAQVTNNGTTTTVDLTQFPIIYATNGTCSSTYSPYNVNYSANTGCGNIFVSGNYSTPVTIGAANDVIIKGSITTNLSGSAVAGLVANNFVRVMHGVTTRSGSTPGSCGTALNISTQTLSNVVIDAAILALNHSFIVDNYDCGLPLGQLTVNGAIAQLFRGTVGTSNSGVVQTGYLKNYAYDDRLKAQEPPFLFALTDASWQITRETSCVPGSTDVNIKC
jgi:Tfp pilus assembly protein PilX